MTGRDHRGKKRAQTIDDISVAAEPLEAQREAVPSCIVVPSVPGERD